MRPKRTRQEDRGQKSDCRNPKEARDARVFNGEDNAEGQDISRGASTRSADKRYSSSPLTRVRRMLSSITSPRQKFAVKHYMATPPPLKGEGASISFQPAGSIAGVGWLPIASIFFGRGKYGYLLARKRRSLRSAPDFHAPSTPQAFCIRLDRKLLLLCSFKTQTRS